jgi:peptidoglycan-associated lipoprotein
MRFKLIGTLAAVALLAACETAPENQAATGSTGAATATAAPATATRPGPRPGSQEDLVQNVGDRVFYDYDKSELRPEARRTVERWAAWLKQYPQVTVTVEGHADERGTREYNLALGQRRANAARDILVANGVSQARVQTISFGKDRPEALGSDESAWAQNRRAVTVVR